MARTESLGRDVKRYRKCRRCGRRSTTIEVELTDSVGFALEAVGKRYNPPRRRF